MISNFKELLFIIVGLSGLPWLIRRLRAKHNITIVLYHKPPAETFRKHIAFLSRRYLFISLDDAVNAIRNKDLSSLPPYPIVVTLDDGHASNYALKDTFDTYQVKPTIYVCSHIVNSKRSFWFEEKQLDTAALKRLPNVERLASLENMGISKDKSYPNAPIQALSLQEMRELSAVGVSFEAHTCYHPILTTCSDAEAEFEIKESKTKIQSLLDTTCNHFAYPNGDYTEREMGITEAAGYRSGRTIDVGFNSKNTPLYALKIMGCSDKGSIHKLTCQLSGINSFFHYLFRGSLTGKKRPIQLVS